MTLNEEKNGKVLVLGLSGKVDVAGTKVLGERLTEVINAGERYILLDFSGVNYINSSGLCALIVAGKRLARTGGVLALAEVNDQIQKVLKISGLASFFTVHRTRALALGAFPQ